MANVAEAYSKARQTSNLRSDPRTAMSAADVLLATGWTAQHHEAAMLLWSLAFNGRTSAKHALVDLLAKRLTEQMIRTREKGDPWRITREVLAWYMENRCQICGGEGHAIVLDTITRSDVVCPHCQGTGKHIALPRIESYAWLAAHIAKMESYAAGCVMARLAKDCDF